MLYKADQTAASRAFIATPGFLAWLFLISSVPAFAAIFFFPIVQTLMRLDIQVKLHWHKLVSLLLAVTILISIPLILQELFDLLSLPIRPLKYHDVKMLILTGIVYFVSFVAVLGIYLVHVRLSTMMQSDSSSDDRIALYLQLRADLHHFLIALGVLTGISVLATSMLRNLILKQPGIDSTQFPPEIVLAFGGFYTLVVAIFYMPTYVTLTAVGQQLCDSIFPLPEPGDEQWAAIYDKRTKLATLLQIQSSVRTNFTDNFIIATPLIGGAISLLLK